MYILSRLGDWRVTVFLEIFTFIFDVYILKNPLAGLGLELVSQGLLK